MSQADPAGFWRRVAAAWIDIFLLYAASSVVIGAASAAGLRLALEPVALVLGAVSGVIALTGWRRTIGKRLLNLEVVSRDAGRLSMRAIVVREALAKWGTLGAAPGLIGRLVLGPAWVPTVYDLLAIIPFALVTALGCALTGRIWYDLLSRTQVVRSETDRARVRPAFAALAVMAILVVVTKGVERAVAGYLPSRVMLYHRMGSLQPFLTYLQKPHASARDYVLGLFDRYDVVVLCEREHSEATQWDFISEVLSDPRFGPHVGHVFTELGQTGMQSYLDEFMATDGLTDREVHDRVLHILRNWSVWPRWNRANFPTYLTRLYAVNQLLPPARRIRHHLTDVATEWSTLTADRMPQHWRSLAHRDEAMAQVILDEVKRLDRTGCRPAKALVVLNYRHAFDLTAGAPGAPLQNTAEFLRRALGDRVATVRINESLFWPAAGGIWDAAIARIRRPQMGFDLAGSPFGPEPFDLFPWRPELRGRLTYQQVFTGLVYLQPPQAQYSLDGIPGYYAGWEAEARRRAGLVGPGDVKTVEKEIALERQGRVPTRTPHVAIQVESTVETLLGGVCSLGFAVGVAAFLLRRRARAPRRLAVTPSVLVRRIHWRWWATLATAIVCAVFLHEIGHCVVAWLHGLAAIPTPAKEYLRASPPPDVQNLIALGGVAGSVLAVVLTMTWLRRRRDVIGSAWLAGALTMPGAYSLRFWLVGRGHDGTEFQEAQAALGLLPSGHALDWLFVGLFVIAAVFWAWHTRPRPSFGLAGRILMAAMAAVFLLVVLQMANNAVFDPLLQR